MNTRANIRYVRLYPFTCHDWAGLLATLGGMQATILNEPITDSRRGASADEQSQRQTIQPTGHSNKQDTPPRNEKVTHPIQKQMRKLCHTTNRRPFLLSTSTRCTTVDTLCVLLFYTVPCELKHTQGETRARIPHVHSCQNPKRGGRPSLHERTNPPQNGDDALTVGERCQNLPSIPVSSNAQSPTPSQRFRRPSKWDEGYKNHPLIIVPSLASVINAPDPFLILHI